MYNSTAMSLKVSQNVKTNWTQKILSQYSVSFPRKLKISNELLPF